MAEDVEAREATYGEKMIEVRVRFWTNEIAEGEGKVRPKHAWGQVSSGFARTSRTESSAASR